MPAPNDTNREDLPVPPNTPPRTMFDDAVRLSLLEQRIEAIENRFENRFDKIEGKLEDLKGQMTKVLVVVGILAGVAGAGGKAAVSALLGVPHSQATAAQVETK